MKSDVSLQKLQKYRWQTPVLALICTPVAPSLLISLGHSSRLGGHNFRLGAQAVIWGGTAPEYPPAAPGLDLVLNDIGLPRHIGEHTVVGSQNLPDILFLRFGQPETQLHIP